MEHPVDGVEDGCFFGREFMRPHVGEFHDAVDVCKGDTFGLHEGLDFIHDFEEFVIAKIVDFRRNACEFRGGGESGAAYAPFPFVVVFQSVVVGCASWRDCYWHLFDEVIGPAWGELELILGHGRAELVFYDVLADVFWQRHWELRRVEPVGEHGVVVGVAGFGGDRSVLGKRAWDGERDAGVDGVDGAVDIAEGDVDAHLGLVG